ncbi:hypothetical protein L208DRAFT_1375848 [Tricholoma matsutake]|nr:hypothetical protein L208DRAFT_1375848 [Tricholoma matsutake 945]
MFVSGRSFVLPFSCEKRDMAQKVEGAVDESFMCLSTPTGEEAIEGVVANTDNKEGVAIEPGDVYSGGKYDEDGVNGRDRGGWCIYGLGNDKQALAALYEAGYTCTCSTDYICPHPYFTRANILHWVSRSSNTSSISSQTALPDPNLSSLPVSYSQVTQPL